MFVSSSEKLLTFNWKSPEVSAGFTKRKGGYSPYPEGSLNLGLHIGDDPECVVKNREVVAEEIEVPLERWVFPEQVHGTKVQTVTAEDRGKGVKDLESAVQGADGLITKNENTLLAGFYADCVPLYFSDKQTGWIGLAHAGWKGTVNHMAGEMIEALVTEGAERESIEMVIGPCISKSNYIVDNHVAQQVSEKYRNDVLQLVDTNTWKLDLKRMNRLIALEHGLGEDRVYSTDHCTYSDEELFFSHRRDRGNTGRMLGYIVKSRC
ncbi:hypothetical protein AAV35_007445 [Salimicrobium jeotgali]|uniref:Purine nucleoside phosphorylase n=1 Tax=Salimicrobium jeotgali TaxID=1230341 RepID=K2G9U4_9BACI|nr:peptidoglycan editing factor PgeF [Salimicrobium jeotgali]AKG04646.1 hypothetical protein AAV35_007445 [Salimicrobium jeotgali]EKE31858.1 hypothetical protein MJ3_06953 [Salimicrobium jeotgali]MBM7696179.1 YfiH family protein [Salimicrobium jeotgali]